MSGSTRNRLLDDQAIDELVVNRMPHFIAVAYDRMLSAVTPLAKVEYAVHVFELGLRALSMSLVSQYLETEKGDAPDQELVKYLRENLVTGTPDVWWEILLRILRAYRNNRHLLFLPELHGLFWQQDTSGELVENDEFQKRFSQLVMQCSRWRSGELSAKKLDTPAQHREQAETLGLLRRVLWDFRFLEKYDLLQIEDVAEADFSAILYTGIQPARTRIVATDCKLEPGRFYLRSKEQETYLNLHPLIIESMQAVENIAKDDSAIYERYRDEGNALLYLLTTSWQFREYPQLVPDFMRLVLDRLSGVDQLEVMRLRWKDVRSIARKISNGRMSGVRGKYTRSLYEQRAKTLQAFESFLASDKVGFILIGSSGVGKSNFVLSLADTERYDQLGVCFLMYNAATVNAQRSLTELVTADFNQRVRISGRSEEGEIENIWQELARVEEIDQRRMVVVFDGLNENDEPKMLLRNINELIEGMDYPWLKVVITVRPESWRQIKRGLKLAESNYYRENGDMHVELDRFDYSHRLDYLETSELERAYERYRQQFHVQTTFSSIPEDAKELMRDPMKLRMIMRIFKEKEIPRRVSAQRLLEHYIEQLIEDTDQMLEREDIRFLEEELMALMFDMGRYDHVITTSQIDEAKTTDGRNVYDLINNAGKVSETRQVNQSFKNLVDTQILVRTYKDGRPSGVEFLYERFYEHFAARRLVMLAGKASDRRGLYEDVASKVKDASYLWGVLRNAIKLELGNRQVGKLSLTNDQIVRLAMSVDQSQQRILKEALVECGSENMVIVDDVLLALFQADSYVPRRKGLPSSDPDEPTPEAKAATNLAIDVAETLERTWLLEQAILHKSLSIRTSGVEAAYHLWKRKPSVGLELLRCLAQQVYVDIGARTVRSLDSCVVLSALLFFEGYFQPDSQVTLQALQEIWRGLLDKVPLIRFGRKKLPWYLEPMRNWLLDIVVRLVLYAIRAAETEDNFVSVAEAEYFFKRDKASRQSIAKLLPYIDPNFGEIDKLRPLLLQAIQGYDLFTGWVILLVMSCQFERHGEGLIDLYNELFYTAVQNKPDTFLAGAVMSALAAHTIETNQYDVWRIQKLTEANFIIFNANEFIYTLPSGKKVQMTSLDNHAVTYVGGGGKLSESELFRYLFAKMKSEKNTRIITNLIGGTFGSARHLGIAYGEPHPQLALEIIGQFVDYEVDEVQDVIKDALASIRIYFPDDVDDYLVEWDLPALSIDVQRRKTTENVYIVLQQKGHGFFNNAILQSPLIRKQFAIPLLRGLVDEDSFADWLRVSLLHLVNLIYGDSEPVQ